MEWLDDGNRLSINHLKHVVETFKSWDDFQKAIQDLPYIQELGTVWQIKTRGAGCKYFVISKQKQALCLTNVENDSINNSISTFSLVLYFKTKQCYRSNTRALFKRFL